MLQKLTICFSLLFWHSTRQGIRSLRTTSKLRPLDLKAVARRKGENNNFSDNHIMPKVKLSRNKETGGGAPSGVKGGLGQHFLRNPAVITSIVQKAGIKPHDIVLEIGPGSGVLTFKMLPLCKKLIAVEIDSRMITELQKKYQLEHGQSASVLNGISTLANKSAVNETDVGNGQLKLINADVLKLDLPFFNLLVANIPYQISSPLVFKLLAHRPQFRSAVLMFQEEFAQRLSAKPGDSLYCRLSVNVQLLAEVHQLLKVGRNNFRPPPKVDSRVVRITPKNPPPQIDFQEWDGLVRLCFNRKNKTLRAVLTPKSALILLEKNMKTYSSLKNLPFEELGHDKMKALVEKVLDEVSMSEKRASKLSVDEFMELLNAFNKSNIRFS